MSPTHWIMVVILIPILACFCYFFVSEGILRRPPLRMRRLIRDRPIGDIDRWYQSSFPELPTNQASFAIAVAECVADCLNVHVTQLRPSDSLGSYFGENRILNLLTIDGRWDWLTTRLTELYEKEAGGPLSDTEYGVVPKGWATMGDIVRSLVEIKSRKVCNAASAANRVDD
jgi:hypothetical protein